MNLRPPTIATWLVTNLTTGPNRESLVGDLVERYQRKQSAVWYWREVGIAVVGSFTSEALRHWWMTAVAIAIARVLPETYVRFLSPPVNIVYSAWYPRSINWLARSGLPDSMWRVLVQLHPWAWTGTLAWCAVLAAVAWVLVRVRPGQRGLILTVFLLSNLVECVPYLLNSFTDWLRDPLNPIWAFNLLWYAVFVLLAVPFSILQGGRDANREAIR